VDYEDLTYIYLQEKESVGDKKFVKTAYIEVKQFYVLEEYIRRLCESQPPRHLARPYNDRKEISASLFFDFAIIFSLFWFKKYYSLYLKWATTDVRLI
jgi:hypothetical protein